MGYRYWTELIGDANDTSLDQYSAAQNASRVGMPLLIIHGDEDQTVPIEQSQLMERAMQRAGKPTRLITLTNGDHYLTPLQGDVMRTVLSETLTFVNTSIGPGVAPGSQ